MNRSEYRVRGTGIKTKFDFVRERFGHDACERYRQRLGDTIRWPVLVGGWYAFDQYTQMLSTIADMFYGGKISDLREVGAYSAEKLLTSTYQAFRADENLPRLIERLPSLYERFYNCGTMTIGYQPAISYCSFRFTGAPVYVDTDMEVAVGFTKRCWGFVGSDAVISSVKITPADARFDLRWAATPQSAAK